MTDKASPAGWVVQVSTQEPGEGPPKFSYFNVAVDAADKAVDAAKKKTKAADNTHISTVRGLSSPELASLDIRPGEVKPA